MTPRRRRFALGLVSVLVAASIVIPVAYLTWPSAQPTPVQLVAPQRDCGLLGHFLAQLRCFGGLFWSIKNHRKFSGHLDSV